MIYKYKDAPIKARITAQVAGDQIEILRERNGGFVQAMDVVNEARPKKSPLHPVFEWDDDVAAELYREDQARHLIRSVVIVSREADDENPEHIVRAFVHIKTESASAYTSVGIAMGDESMRQHVLDRAWREIESWRRRYENLEEFAHVLAVIERETIRRAS